MAAAEKFWISSLQGDHAVVDGADELATWTRVRGWLPAAEPVDDNVQVHVVNGELTARLPWGALKPGNDLADKGWEPGPPPAPVDLTKDPAPLVVPKQTPAAAGKTKE